MDYKKLDNETDFEWKLRLCKAKVKKEITLSWQDIVDTLDLGISADKLRHDAYAYVEYGDYVDEKKKDFSDDDYLKQVEEKEKALRKERVKLQTANIERNRLDRNESRQEMYYEFVGKVIETLPLPDFEPLSYPEKEVDRFCDMEYLVGISDLHYGAKFKSENNEYSPEICKDRLEVLVSELEIFCKEKNLCKLHIAMLGDALQGVLRLSDLKLNDTTVVKATVEVSRLLAQFLNSVSKFAEVEYYHTPSANHCQLRPLGSKASEISDEDLEYVISNYIKDLCAANERIHVHLAEEGKQYIEIPIKGFNILAMHGHQIKNVENSLKDLSMFTHRFVDYLILGHFHAGKEIPSGESCINDTQVLVNPSLVGSCPYSDSLFKGSKAAVKLYGFDYMYGYVDMKKIILN